MIFLIVARVSTVPEFDAPRFHQMMNISIAEAVNSILFSLFSNTSFVMVTKCFFLSSLAKRKRGIKSNCKYFLFNTIDIISSTSLTLIPCYDHISPPVL